MCIEGSPESEVHDELAPLPGEKIILKHRYSAFYNTDLETVLRCLKTARDAYYRDYKVFFLADGTGSINEEMHTASLLNLSFGFANVITVDKILSGLK